MPDGSFVQPDGLIGFDAGSGRWVALVEVKTGTTELDKDASRGVPRRCAPQEIRRRRHHLESDRAGHRRSSSEGPRRKAQGRCRFASHVVGGVAYRGRHGARTTAASPTPNRHGSSANSSPTLSTRAPGRCSSRTWDNTGRPSATAREPAPLDQPTTVSRMWLSGGMNSPATSAFNWAACSGADVQQVLARRDRRRCRRAPEAIGEDAWLRLGVLECTLRVPAAVADINLSADLKTRTISASLQVDAPGDGRPRTRVNWLVRQLRERCAPGDLRVDASFESRSWITTSDPARSADRPSIPTRRCWRTGDDRPRRFRVTLTRDMGMARGTGARSFIGSITALLDEFYRTVTQNLEAWKPSAPRLPRQTDEGESEPPAEAANIGAPETDE